jgi:putative membrane protein
VSLVIRWISNTLALFVGLYLLDSLAHGGIQVKAAWAAFLIALLLGLLNSLVRPLPRLRDKPMNAALSALLTIVFNAFVIEILSLAGSPMTVRNPVWALVAGLFIAVLTGVINWLVGFDKKTKERQDTVMTTGFDLGASASRAARSRVPRGRAQRPSPSRNSSARRGTAGSREPGRRRT